MDECFDAEDRPYKWEISPHPQTSDADSLVCDDDDEAREWFLAAAEAAWDDCAPGETRTITITHHHITAQGKEV